MADYAHAYTDEQIKDLERQIHAVYAEASRDMQAKLDEFNAKFEVKDRAHREDVASGRWTQEQYDNWRQGQIFQTQQWEAKRDDLVNTMHNANVVAAQMINGRAPDVFGVNASYMNYTLENAAGVNFGFGIYDASTVARLIQENPQMLPEWKIDEKKDYVWNEKKVNNAVTQGIIQGESLNQISRRISQDLVMQNENLSRTFAQTAMTGAQNAGRQESLEHATAMGIEVYKQWMATLDSHTRDSHADVDGESVPVDAKFSNGLQYPAEAGGPPAEVYNCRCTMVGDLKKYPEKFKRYNNEKGRAISYTTYKDWEKAKEYGRAGYRASMSSAKPKPEPKPETQVEPVVPQTTQVVQDVQDVQAGAVPRTADYINGVTEHGLSNNSYAGECIDRQIKKVAQELGVSEEEAKRAIENGLTRIVEESDFTMRITARNLERVLDGGYFKNQFETGSSGGMYDPDERARLENRMFNVPIKNFDDANRPVYGMFCPRYDENDYGIRYYYARGAGSWYGDGVTVVLNKDALYNNATMTIGDSLDYRSRIVATEVNNISYAGVHSHCTTSDLVDIARLTSESTPQEVYTVMRQVAGGSDHYFEYQLHGRETHSADNIDFVVITKGTADRNPQLLEMLDERNIPYYINSGV